MRRGPIALPLLEGIRVDVEVGQACPCEEIDGINFGQDLKKSNSSLFLLPTKIIRAGYESLNHHCVFLGAEGVPHRDHAAEPGHVPKRKFHDVVGSTRRAATCCAGPLSLTC